MATKDIIPYYDQLIKLALCQQDLGGAVRFHFEAIRGGDREAVVVYPLLEVAREKETLPFFNYLDLDPIQLWINFGYVDLLEGSLAKGMGVFALTAKTLNLKLVRSAG